MSKPASKLRAEAIEADQVNHPKEKGSMIEPLSLGHALS